jgi:molybdate transport repressor ModE-like protein
MAKKYSNLNGGAQFVIYAKGSRRRGAFRRGVNALLRGVRDLGSLKKASEPLWMGYSSAERILKETEETLDVKLTENYGRNGTGLTEEGKKLLVIYQEINAELNLMAELRFKELINREFSQDDR